MTQLKKSSIDSQLSRLRKYIFKNISLIIIISIYVTIIVVMLITKSINLRFSLAISSMVLTLLISELLRREMILKNYQFRLKRIQSICLGIIYLLILTIIYMYEPLFQNI